jgi:hypothetical protein
VPKKRRAFTPSPLGAELRRLSDASGLSQEDFHRAVAADLATFRNFQRWLSGEVQKIPGEVMDRARKFKRR